MIKVISFSYFQLKRSPDREAGSLQKLAHFYSSRDERFLFADKFKDCVTSLGCYLQQKVLERLQNFQRETKLHQIYEPFIISGTRSG